MKVHESYTISFTAHAERLCKDMNKLVHGGMPVDKASAHLGLSKTSGRRYYNGSYDVNPGWKVYLRKGSSFTCMRRGACVPNPNFG